MRRGMLFVLAGSAATAMAIGIPLIAGANSGSPSGNSGVTGATGPGAVTATTQTATPSTDATTTAVEQAFTTAENNWYALFAPPEARGVAFGSPPAQVNVTSVQSANGVLPAAFTPAEKTQMLADAQSALAASVSPNIASYIYQHVDKLTTSDQGPGLTLIGGEGAYVVSYQSVSLQSTTSATVNATVMIWNQDGTLTSQGIADATAAVGSTVQTSSADVTWDLIKNELNVTATMQLGADGVWREALRDAKFAPGWNP